MDWSPVAAALSAVTVQWLQPLNVVLLVGIVMFARYMHKANQRTDFDVVDALRGPDNKCSMKQISYLVAIILGAWVLMDCAASWLTQPIPFVYLFIAWFGLSVAPKIVAELIQAKFGQKRDGKDDHEHRDP